MRIKGIKYSIMLVAATTMMFSCGEDEDGNPTVGGVSVPKLTGSVGGGNSASSVSASSALLLLNDPNACASCDDEAKSVFGMASLFIQQGKSADGFGCVTEALINGGHLPNDGTEVIIDSGDGTFKAKMSAVVSGSTVSTYDIRVCEGANATSNSQFMEGSVDSANVASVTMKYNGTGMKAYISTSGTYSSGSWSGKSLTMEFESSSVISKFEITQNADNMILKGVHDFADINLPDFFAYSKFALLGDSVANYAMDVGSAKYKHDSTEGTQHWDTDGRDAADSIYSGDVASASYLALPTFSGDMSTDEQWDCANGSTRVVNMSDLGASTSSDIQACFQ